MNFQAILQQICTAQGWAMVLTTTGARIEIRTEYNRTQVIEITFGMGPQNEQMLYLWSNIAPATQINDPWYLLQYNANLTYGGIAMRDQMLFLMDSVPVYNLEPQTLTIILTYIATTADQLEKQFVGYDNN